MTARTDILVWLTKTDYPDKDRPPRLNRDVSPEPICIMHNQLIPSSHIRISCFRFPRSPVNISVIIRIRSLCVLYLPVYWHVPQHVPHMFLNMFLSCSSVFQFLTWATWTISSTCTSHDFQMILRACSSHVPRMFLACSSHVPHMFLACSSHVPHMACQMLVGFWH